MKINEIFLSIQGEGMLVGLPTIFVRTQGCNLRCSYCDTKYAYYDGNDLSVTQVVNEIEKFYVKRVCITGGEPLLQNDINDLVQILINNRYEVSIETNGSISIGKIINNSNLLFSLDIKCPSSGSHNMMDFNNLNFIQKKDQIKFIIGNESDFDFACAIVNNKNLCAKTNVFYCPVWGVDTKNLVQSILNKKMDVRVGLQIHKIIWDSNMRGV